MRPEQREALASDAEPEKISCIYCGASTIFVGTDQCNNCWEAAHRIQDFSTQVLQKILEHRRPEDHWKPR